ncbi:Rik1-associated factor 1 [Bienertia sinuspersici]
MAARHGLQIAMEAGFHHLILEVDNSKVFNHLHKRMNECTAFGGVIKDISSLASCCNALSYSFVKREGNKVAHYLARESRN